MSKADQKITLTERERAVLKILGSEQVRKGATPTGRYLEIMMSKAGLDTSPQGAHRTAASLCRKRLAERLGNSRLQWYGITMLGREVLRRG